jgi:hypothetical protein
LILVKVGHRCRGRIQGKEQAMILYHFAAMENVEAVQRDGPTGVVAGVA